MDITVSSSVIGLRKLWSQAAVLLLALVVCVATLLVAANYLLKAFFF
jgi:hypothetical protein